MLQSIYNTVKNIRTICKNERSWKNKREILGAFAKLSCNMIINPIMNPKKRKERFLNYKMHFFTYDVFFWLFYEIFIRKEYVFKTTKQNPTILDCGSNIGMAILFFKRNYPQAEIIGFEPDHASFQLLKKNIEINRFTNIVVHNVALSNKEGTIPFYSDGNTKGKLAMSITKQIEDHNIKNVKETKVKAVKLSTFIPKEKEIDFMKLDIEGAELLVLEDLDKSKRIKQIKEMLVEYHFSTKNPTNKITKILEILEKNNFKYCFNAETQPPFPKMQNKAYNVLIYAYQ
jgi:FkbM family methyltransferase